MYDLMGFSRIFGLVPAVSLGLNVRANRSMRRDVERIALRFHLFFENVAQRANGFPSSGSVRLPTIVRGHCPLPDCRIGGLFVAQCKIWIDSRRPASWYVAGDR